MGEYIGAIGSLLMFILISCLVYCFLLDSNILKKRKIDLNIKKILIAIVGLFILQIIVCGIIASFFDDNSLHIYHSNIWKNTIVFDKLFRIDFKYNFNLIFHNGNFPFYYYIIDFLGFVLFKAYDDISLYIGFICGLSSYLLMYSIVKNYYKKINKQQLMELLLLIPGSAFLFVPTPFSLEIVLMLLFIYCLMHKKSNMLLLLISIVCAFFHLLGFAAIIIYILYRFLGKKYKNNISLIVIITLLIILAVVGMVFDWNNWYEIIASLNICLLFSCGKIITSNVFKVVKIIFIIINAYLLFGILLNIF